MAVVGSGAIIEDPVLDVEDCRRDLLSGLIFNLPAKDFAAARGPVWNPFLVSDSFGSIDFHRLHPSKSINAYKLHQLSLSVILYDKVKG